MLASALFFVCDPGGIMHKATLDRVLSHIRPSLKWPRFIWTKCAVNGRSHDQMGRVRCEATDQFAVAATNDSARKRDERCLLTYKQNYCLRSAFPAINRHQQRFQVTRSPNSPCGAVPPFRHPGSVISCRPSKAFVQSHCAHCDVWVV